MKYKFGGSLEIRIPEGLEFTGEGESKEEAILNMLSKIVEDGSVGECLVTDYLKTKAVRKVFTVTVTETFTHKVTISTDDYPEIEDESDAEYYVENNLEDFNDDFDYTEWERERLETDCQWRDTEEEELDC